MNIRSLCIIIIFIVSLVFPVKSQGVSYASINFDKAAITALESAFLEELSEENKILSDIKDISKHHFEASIAMSGIYLLKRQDRKALEEEKRFAEQEFYYYQLCCRFASLIMVKVVNITILLAERPEAILQWGPFLYDVVTNTKEHCKQFSAIVTNGKRKVTLEDYARTIGWLSFGDQMIEILTLMRFANVDWGSMIDNFSKDFDKLTNDITIEDIGDAFTSLFNKGKDLAKNDLASAGDEILDEMIGPIEDAVKSNENQNGGSESTNKKKKILEKTKSTIKTIKTTVESIMDIYDIVNDPQKIKALFLEKLGLSEPLDPRAVVNKIFKSDGNDLDISSYVNDYNTPDSMMTYQQEWYIVKKVDKSEVVDEFNPLLPENEDKWVHFYEKHGDTFSLTPDEYEQVMKNSEGFLQNGWTRDKCYKESKANDEYIFTSQLNSKRDSWDTWFGELSWWKAAYYIRVTHEVHSEKQVYSKMYFSDKQDETLFEMEMAKIMYNDWVAPNTDPDVKFELVQGPKVYTEKPDTAKLKNCGNVIFKVKCGDSGDVSKGDFWWKVNPRFRYKNLNSEEARQKAIEYAMKPGTEENLGTLTSEVDAAIQSINDSIADFKKERSNLEARNEQISNEIINARNQVNSSDIIDALNAEKTKNTARIAEINKEINRLNSHKEELEKGKTEIMDDYYEKDTGNRIPSKENDLAQMFKLKWVNDVGTWNGLTYTHKATVGGEVGYQYTFTAELSLKKPEKTIIFGIRIHRAQLQVKWSLTGKVESENVASVVPIDSTWTIEQKEARLNQELVYLRQMYPDCDISMEYEKIDNVQEDDKNVIHLLWPHERLALARELSSRLIDIYSQLIGVERYIHYTKNVKDWMKMKLKCPMRPPKRGNKADSCFRKWLDRADKYVQSNNSIL